MLGLCGVWEVEQQLLHQAERARTHTHSPFTCYRPIKQVETMEAEMEELQVRCLTAWALGLAGAGAALRRPRISAASRALDVYV